MEYELRSIANSIDFRGIEYRLDSIDYQLNDIKTRLGNSNFTICISRTVNGYEMSYTENDYTIYKQGVDWKFDLSKYFKDIGAEGSAYHIKFQTTNIKNVIARLATVTFKDIEF